MALVTLIVLCMVIVPVTGQTLQIEKISAQPNSVHTGDVITVIMTVKNTGTVIAQGVTPSLKVKPLVGTASANLMSGPTPATADIPADGSQDFTWSFVANSGADGGKIRFEGNADTSAKGNSNIVSVFPYCGNLQAAIPLDTNRQICPLGQNQIRRAEDYVVPLENKIEKEDAEEAKKKLDEAKRLLEKAKTEYRSGNCIAANNSAQEAIRLFRECMELLGLPTGEDSDLDLRINQILSEAAKEVRSSEEEITQAENEGKDTSVAKGWLQKAKDAIGKAHQYIPTDKPLAYLWAEKADYYLYKCRENLPDC